MEARHYLARAFYADDEFLSAVSEFTRIVQVYPDHERTREAYLGLCRSYAAMSPHPQRDQQYTVQARTTCQNVAGDSRACPRETRRRSWLWRCMRSWQRRATGKGTSTSSEIFSRRPSLSLSPFWTSFRTPRWRRRHWPDWIEIYQEWEWSEQEEEFKTRLLETYPESPEAKALEQAAASDTVSVVRSRAPPGPGRLMAWMAARG